MSSHPDPVVADLPDADVRYWPRFLSAPEADDLLERISRETTWEQHRVRVFGRTHPCPRRSAWYGEPGAVYRYSGQTLSPRPIGAALGELRARVQSLLDHEFDGVLLNLYRDGNDAMGMHSDDERELGPRPVIASVSLGAERRFRLKHRDRAQPAELDWPLGHGSLVVMAGDTQRYWRHGVPRTRRVVGARLNLSFRRLAAPDDETRRRVDASHAGGGRS